MLAHASLLDHENCGNIGLMRSNHLPATCKEYGKQDLVITITEIMKELDPTVQLMETDPNIVEDIEKQQSGAAANGFPHSGIRDSNNDIVTVDGFTNLSPTNSEPLRISSLSFD